MQMIISNDEGNELCRMSKAPVVPDVGETIDICGTDMIVYERKFFIDNALYVVILKVKNADGA